MEVEVEVKVEVVDGGRLHVDVDFGDGEPVDVMRCLLLAGASSSDDGILV